MRRDVRGGGEGRRVEGSQASGRELISLVRGERVGGWVCILFILFMQSEDIGSLQKQAG